MFRIGNAKILADFSRIATKVLVCFRPQLPCTAMATILSDISRASCDPLRTCCQSTKGAQWTFAGHFAPNQIPISKTQVVTYAIHGEKTAVPWYVAVDGHEKSSRMGVVGFQPCSSPAWPTSVGLQIHCCHNFPLFQAGPSSFGQKPGPGLIVIKALTKR